MIQSIKQPHPVKLGAHFLPPKTALDLVGEILTGHKPTDDKTIKAALTDLVCAKLVGGNNQKFLDDVCGLFLVHQDVLGIVTPSALINNANAQNLKIKKPEPSENARPLFHQKGLSGSQPKTG